MDIITLIIAGVSTAATVVIAIFTYKTIQAYEKQVQVSQEQVRVSQDQLLNQFRPVLHPAGNLGSIINTVDGRDYIQWVIPFPVTRGLRNIGVGPAFNIYGILFGPHMNAKTIDPRFVVWNYPSLSPGEEGEKITLQQFSNLSSTTMIGGYSLCVPDDIDHQHILARFSLTYHDVFGRKHASIYDYDALYEWRYVAHCPDIKYDIRELDQQDPTTQASERFYHDAGKRAQP